ncbi:MAG: M12 family metallo-peptidase [Phycisphaerales bacterium]|nr:M12 family metallo-peptidase [Phycisphaerales bacterium]
MVEAMWSLAVALTTSLHGAPTLSASLQQAVTPVTVVFREGDLEQEVTLDQISSIQDGLTIEVAGEGPPRPAQFSPRRFWRGDVNDGLLFLVSSPEGVRGWVRRQGRFHSVVAGGDRLLQGAQATAVEDRRPCGGRPPREVPAPRTATERRTERGQPQRACRQIRIAFDTDWEFTNDVFGGDPDAAAAYVLELAAAVSVIYAADLDVTLQISYIRTWSDPSDPYDPTEVDDDLLDQFRAEWIANAPESDRHVAHLMSGSHAPASSGLAWRSSTCQSHGYSYSSGIDGSFANPPPAHSWNIWDLLVVSHEVGHNLGAMHTHEMNPPIDGCGLGNCANAWGGSIMSYCHTCAPNYYSNISMEFHPRVRSDILTHLSAVEGVSCDFTVTISTDVDGSGTVDLTDLMLLIGQFGTCLACDCTADADGSGEVDVWDLLQLLNEWG